MPSAADWITLGEAAELLAAANVHFARETIGGWARTGKLSSIKIAAEDLQPGLFEDLP